MLNLATNAQLHHHSYPHEFYCSLVFNDILICGLFFVNLIIHYIWCNRVFTFLDVVVWKCASILQLLSSKDQTLLIRGNSWKTKNKQQILINQSTVTCAKTSSDQCFGASIDCTIFAVLWDDNIPHYTVLHLFNLGCNTKNTCANSMLTIKLKISQQFFHKIDGLWQSKDYAEYWVLTQQEMVNGY